MKKTALLALLFLTCVLNSFGQVIRGVVLDSGSGLPIDFASVFFSGTFVGTTTDSEGHFELDIGEYKSRPVTISAVGYYSRMLSEFDPDESLNVELKERVYELEEAEVTTSSLVRKRKACMRIFKQEFIGLSSNARRCYILNEQDIHFNYDSDKDTLRAYASRPIKIQNLSLGYDITYHLDRFEYVRKTQKVTYTGNIVFDRDLLAEGDNSSNYERRRAYAYSGSTKHFFMVLWSNTLEGSGFHISDYKTEKSLYYEDLVYQDYEGRKYLAYKEDLQINYYDNISYISFVEYQMYFGADGYFDPIPIVWTGIMSKERIADSLPYEYSFTSKEFIGH
ncbi:MAG: carboxypeptidase-like regulatory domain-containing protein [bacterium]